MEPRSLLPTHADEDLPEPVLVLARTAVDYVRRALGVEMDASTDSLAFLDHYASGLAREQPAIIALLAPSLGCFFGEVVRRHLAGRWGATGDDPRAFRVELSSCFLYFRPVGLAADVLSRGQALEEPGADLDPGIVVAPADDDLLSDRLAESSVDEAYYYSFTGRLETLERMADFLVARRLVTDRVPSPPGEPVPPAPIPAALYEQEIQRRRS